MIGLRLPSAIVLFALALAPTSARAQSADDLAAFGADAFSKIDQLLTDGVVSSLIKTVGFATDFQAYQPATPLGMGIGLDFGIELTLAHLPDTFYSALDTAGAGSATKIPSLPVPRFIIHKGIGSRVDVGASFIFYRGNYIAGGDIKIALSLPDEGPAWALRVSYNRTDLGVIFTQTITPQLLISKKLAFADPYMGIGYQYTLGKISVPLSTLADAAGVPDVPDNLPEGVDINITDGEITKTASSSNFISFLGVGFVLGPTGIKLAFGGTYSIAGTHTLGLTFGFSF